jgi:hypothetical protein
LTCAEFDSNQRTRNYEAEWLNIQPTMAHG